MISANPKPAPTKGQFRQEPEPSSRHVMQRFCPIALGITEIEGGFPHSDIHGSKPVRGSPWLFAAYHVLHRLSAPRHPPDTLTTLDRSHYRCPPCTTLGRDVYGRRARRGMDNDHKDQFASNISGSAAVSRAHNLGRLPENPQPCSSGPSATGYISSLRCKISNTINARSPWATGTQ